MISTTCLDILQVLSESTRSLLEFLSTCVAQLSCFSSTTPDTMHALAKLSLSTRTADYSVGKSGAKDKRNRKYHKSMTEIVPGNVSNESC